MSGITSSLLLFALYIYFPLICVKGGVSFRFELRQNNPDRDGFLAIYFVSSLIITILFYQFSRWATGHGVDWKVVLMSIVPISTTGSNSPLVDALNGINFDRTVFFLVLNYILNALGGLLISYLIPESHISPWQRTLKLDKQFKKTFEKKIDGVKVETRIDILTKSGFCYSGNLESIITNKDDVIDICTLNGKIKRFDIKSTTITTPVVIPSYKMLFNNSDISNFNIRHFYLFEDGSESEIMFKNIEGKFSDIKEDVGTIE